MKAFIWLLINFIGLCIVLGTPLFANVSEDEGSPSGVISGKVTEEGTRDPMEFTTIAIYSVSDSTLIGGTVSDRDGNFEVSKLPYGEYYVVTNFVGYNRKVIEPIVLTPGARKIDLGILEMSIDTQSIEEVEVVGNRKHVEYRLDKKVVNVSQDLNAAGGTAVDVLENTPSVSVDIEGNVSLRGSSSFTVLIDGKPSVLEGSDALQQIPASAIENIEIITNPSAKYDPDGNSGIINIVMKKKVRQGTNGIVNASAGYIDRYRFDALLNRQVNNWNFFIGGNYNSNYYPGDLTRQQITFTDSLDNYLDADGAFDFRRGGAQLKGGFTYDFSERSSFSLEANAGNYQFGIDRSNRTHEYTLPATEDIYYVSESIMDRDARYYSLNANYTQTFDSKDHKLVAMAFFSQSDGTGIDSQNDYNTEADYVIEDVMAERTRGVESEDEIEFRFQVDYSRPVRENGKLEAGYQIRVDDELEDFVFEEYDHSQEEWIINERYTSPLDFYRAIQGVYATYGGQTGDFQYQLGIRGEHTLRRLEREASGDVYEINRLDYYPTIHLSRQFNNDQQLMLSYSKRVDRPRGYYLDPNPSYVDPYTVRIGNPDLQPEYIHSAELGYQKGWGQNFLAFELYYRNTRNLITRLTEYSESEDLFYIRNENLNNDHSAGAEMMANWQFWKWLRVNGSFTPYYYRINGEINGSPVDESSFNWRSNLNATFQITPTTRLQTNVSYRSRSITAQGTMEGFAYMNLAFRQDLLDRKLSATLQLRDVFGSAKREMTSVGENFEQYVLMQRQPRMLTLTLSYRINNYRTDSRDRGGSGGGEGMDFGGGF